MDDHDDSPEGKEIDPWFRLFRTRLCALPCELHFIPSLRLEWDCEAPHPIFNEALTPGVRQIQDQHLSAERAFLNDVSWASHMLNSSSGPDLPLHICTHFHSYTGTHTHTHTESLLRANLVRQEPTLQSHSRIRNDSLPGLLIYLKFHYWTFIPLNLGNVFLWNCLPENTSIPRRGHT